MEKACCWKCGRHVAHSARDQDALNFTDAARTHINDEVGLAALLAVFSTADGILACGYGSSINGTGAKVTGSVDSRTDEVGRVDGLSFCSSAFVWLIWKRIENCLLQSVGAY